MAKMVKRKNVVKMMKMKTIIKMNDMEIVVKERVNVENKETVMTIRTVEMNTMTVAEMWRMNAVVKTMEVKIIVGTREKSL